MAAERALVVVLARLWSQGWLTDTRRSLAGWGLSLQDCCDEPDNDVGNNDWRSGDSSNCRDTRDESSGGVQHNAEQPEQRQPEHDRDSSAERVYRAVLARWWPTSRVARWLFGWRSSWWWLLHG